MFGFSHKSTNSQQPAKTVRLVKDTSGAPAVSLSKVEQEGGVSLLKKTEAAGISLSKKNLAGIRAQVVVLLDHSGSMYSDYANHKVQDLTERFLAFGLQVDVDGSVPVIPFDSKVKDAVDVNLGNYKDIVEQQIWQKNNMGSTDLAAALKQVRKLSEKSDTPIFCAVVTDGEPDDRFDAEEVVKDLSRYPVFIKFLAVKPVQFLNKLDDLDSSQRLLDNVDTKSYQDLSSVSDAQFADDMVDEWDSWTTAATVAGVLSDS